MTFVFLKQLFCTFSFQEMYRYGGQNVKDELQRYHLRPAQVATFITIQIEVFQNLPSAW